MIIAESIQCLQKLHLFASKYVSLNSLVPYLLEYLIIDSKYTQKTTNKIKRNSKLRN